MGMGFGKALKHVFDDQRRIIDDSLHKIEMLFARSERRGLRPWVGPVDTLNTGPPGLSKSRV
jgi:hypothetical protein